MQPDNNSPEDKEAAWQAWLKENKAKEAFRYERRLRAIVLIAVFLALSALLWRFIG